MRISLTSSRHQFDADPQHFCASCECSLTETTFLRYLNIYEKKKEFKKRKTCYTPKGVLGVAEHLNNLGDLSHVLSRLYQLEQILQAAVQRKRRVSAPPLLIVSLLLPLLLGSAHGIKHRYFITAMYGTGTYLTTRRIMRQNRENLRLPETLT